MSADQSEETARNPDQPLEKDSRGPILETAYRLLGSTPYDKLSMQTIADSAGVSKALLFYFFKSKRELVREALIWGSRKEVALLTKDNSNPITNGNDAEISLSDHITSWMASSMERIQILHTYLEVTDIDDSGDPVNMELKELFGHIIGHLETFLRDRDINFPREKATLMAVMIDTFGFLPYLTKDPFDADRFRAAFLDLFGCRGND